MAILTGLALGGSALHLLRRLRDMRERAARRAGDRRPAGDSSRSRALEAMSPAEAEAAHQQQVAAGAVGMFAAGGLVGSTLSVAGLPLLAYGYLHMMRGIRDALRRRRKLTVVVFDALTVSFAVFMGFFFTAAVLFTALFTANRLVARTERQAHGDFTRIFGELADTVWLLKDGCEVAVPLESLAAGDVIVVHAGAMIPVDGTVLAGEGLVDQHLLTGEAQPVEKDIGDPVLTSTLLISGQLQVQVERQGSDTVTGQIAQTLEHAAAFKQAMQSRGERIVEKGAARTLVASAVAVPIIGVNQGIALSYSGFGYQMRMTAPLMVLNYLRVASRQGILIKDGRALDRLGRVDTVVFDKTGTLTETVPRVGRVVPAAGFSEWELLQLAASAEQRQKHPIAQAICGRAAEQGLTLLPMVDSEYAIGHGLEADLAWAGASRRVLIGSRRFIESRGLVLPPALAALATAAGADGHTVVYAATGNGRLIGALELCPTIRPQARAAVAALHGLGLELTIISGDQEQPTRKLAADLGIDRYFAETLPADKGRIVDELKAAGRTVCFVGDGINDSLALSRSDVAVSLHGAATIAQDTAEVVLMAPDLSLLPELVRLGRDLGRRMDWSERLNNLSGVACVGGVLILGMGVSGAIALYAAGLLTNLGNAMLPLAARPSAGPGPAPDFDTDANEPDGTGPVPPPALWR